MSHQVGCIRIVVDAVLFFVVYSIIPASNSGLRFLIAFIAVGIIEAVRSGPSRPRIRLASSGLILIVFVSIIVVGIGGAIELHQDFQAVALAHKGSNLGKIIKGQHQVWRYAGKAGEVLSLRANADITPSLNLLDTFLTIRSSDGSTLAENNDAVLFFDTNALIPDLKLPADASMKSKCAIRSTCTRGSTISLLARVVGM